MIWFDNDESWGSRELLGPEAVHEQRRRPGRAQHADRRRPGDRALTAASSCPRGPPGRLRRRAGHRNATATMLFADDFAGAGSTWSPVRPARGRSSDGEYVQSVDHGHRRALASLPTPTRGLDELHARARRPQGLGVRGLPGRLRAPGGPNDYYWWNLGGWNNTRSVLQQADGGAANEVAAVEGHRIATGRDLPGEDRGRRTDRSSSTSTGCCRSRYDRADGARASTRWSPATRRPASSCQGREPHRIDGAHRRVGHRRARRSTTRSRSPRWSARPAT